MTTATLPALDPVAVLARILDAIRAKNKLAAVGHKEVAAAYEIRIDRALHTLDRGNVLAAGVEADDVVTRAEVLLAL